MLLRRLGLATLLMAVPMGPAAAQGAADFYRNKTLKIIVPSAPGGDRALYALAFAAYFGKHVPGNPTVVPAFMPGAGGAAGVNYAYNIAPPDGLSIVTPLANVIIAQATGDDAVKYDASKFNWIGRTADATRVLMVSSSVAVHGLDDLRRREIVVGAAGRTSETFMNPALMNKMLGTRFKIVNGYLTAGRMNMAVEAKETEAAFTTWNDLSSQHPDWLRDGKVRVVLQIAPAKHPDLATVPLLSDWAERTEDKAVMEFLASSSQMGQSWAAPPGVPPAMVQVLRQAFDATMRDPELVEKLRVGHIQFNPMNGGDLAAVVARTIAAPRSVIDRYKMLIATD